MDKLQQMREIRTNLPYKSVETRRIAGGILEGELSGAKGERSSNGQKKPVESSTPR